MFGNVIGWIIAAGVTVVTLLAVSNINAGHRITPPTPFSHDPANLAEITLPPAPIGIVATHSSADMTEKFRQAIQSDLQHSNLDDDFGRNPQGDIPPAVQLALDASGSSGAANVFTPEEVIDYEYAHPTLDAAEHLGTILQGAALRLIRAGKPADAQAYAGAAYSLGLQMTGQRLSWAEFNDGVGMMSGAAHVLSEAAAALPDADKSHANDLEKYSNNLRDYSVKTILPLIKVLTAVGNRDTQQAGDVFYLVAHSKDRMVRICGILKLGMDRFDINVQAGDSNAAEVYLQKLMHDGDTAIAYAAGVATKLTLEDFRKIH